MNKGNTAVCEVVGNLQDVAYQRCSLILQELAVLHPSFLAKSVGMMETDYFEYVQAHQAQLPSGAANRLLQSASPFVLIDSKVFLNGEDALLEFAATKTQLSKSEILAAAAFSASEHSVLDPTSAEYTTQLEQAEMTLETRAEAAAQEALFQYRKTSGHQFAFFIFAVDGVTLPRVEVELFQDVCPSTCKNFAALCRGTVPDVGDDERMLGYKGISVHRVVKGGWIQTGDVAGDGRGDGPRRSIYGRDFPDESFAISHSAAGIVVRSAYRSRRVMTC